MNFSPESLLDNPLLRTDLIERRDYQLGIACNAVKKNTLVVLPTALGKTVIAVITAAHFLYNYSDKKVLVMAPTRPLVLQHWQTFLKFLRLRPSDVVVLTGKNPPQYRMNAWNSQARLYFCTPQVVANDHERGLRLSDFSLLVFDECHRARKNYAYTKVAQAYVRESPYPMILAMTASPGSERSRILELCRALYIENIEVRTEEDSDVRSYLAPVGVEWVYVELPPAYQQIREGIKQILEQRLSSLVETGFIRKKPRYVRRSDLIELGEKIARQLDQEKRGELFGILLLQASAMTLSHALELLETQGMFALKKFVERLLRSTKRSHKSVISELRKNGLLEKILSTEGIDHPKLEKVMRVLTEEFARNPDSRVIVFTHFRETSRLLCQKLKEKGIRAERFVGQASKEGEAGMSQEQQAAILERFRDGDIRVLVATSVGEEGLDIPSVDLVIFYEPVPSEIRYIQRKGRTGRRRFGRVVILAASKTLDETYLWSSRHKLRRMKREIRKLNLELHPILRLGEPPKPNPMRPEELAPADEMPSISELEDQERFRTRRLNREIARASRHIYRKILEHGEADFQQIVSEMVDDGVPSDVVERAIHNLLGSGQIVKEDDRLMPAGSSLGRTLGSKRYLFEVEKVMMGKAILIVDNKWRSVLIPQEYSGPRDLIRRGAKFEATAEFYNQEGKLHARIYSVDRILS